LVGTTATTTPDFPDMVRIGDKLQPLATRRFNIDLLYPYFVGAKSDDFFTYVCDGF